MPAALPLLGAGLGISAGLSAGGLIGGLMVAGGALTGIGALTGNKKLTMLGAVLGLGAGFANAFGSSSASVADAAASEAAKNGVFTNEAAAANGLDTAAQTAADTAAAAGDAAVAGSAADQAIAGASNVDTSPISKWGLDNNPMDRGIIDSAVNGPTGYESGGPSTGVYGQPEAASSGVQASSKWGADNNPADRAAGSAAPAKAASWWDKFSDTAGGAVKWAKDNPELVKTGAGLVSGAMKSYGDEELAKNDMKRQMAYKDWVRQRYSDSVRNLQVPAVVLQPNQAPGIIAQTRT